MEPSTLALVRELQLEAWRYRIAMLKYRALYNRHVRRGGDELRRYELLSDFRCYASCAAAKYAQARQLMGIE